MEYSNYPGPASDSASGSAFGSASGSAFGSASGSEDGSAEEESPLWISVLQIIFCGIGLLGNLTVIFVILALKEYKKTVTNWYVLQLAIADLMFLCTIPIKIKEKRDGKWPGSDALCKLNESLIFLNYNSSILFLTVMSIDRYLIVCHNSSPLSQTLRKRSTAYIATAIVWAISLLFCTPIFMYSGVTNCKCIYEFAKKHKTPEEECREYYGMENDMEKCIDMLKRIADNPSNCDGDESDYEEFLKSTNGTQYDYDYEDDPAVDPYDSSDSTNGSFVSGASSFNDSQQESYYDISGGSSGSGELPFECSYKNESNAWLAFIYFNFIVLFIIPFIIMLMCYSLIVKMMLQSGSRKTTLTPGPSNENERPKKQTRKLTKSEKTFRRATRLCVAYVVLFAICWLPFHSVHLAKISGIDRTSGFCLNISSVVFILVIVNSMINPCLYSIVGKKFSGRLRNAFASLQGKIASQVDSLSSTSGLAVRYRRGKRHGSRSYSNSATATTKIYKGKSEAESSDPSSGDGLRDSGSG